MWDSLSVKDCSSLLVLKRIEKAAVILNSFTQHYLEIDQPEAAYLSIKHFTRLIRQHHFGFSEGAHSEINRFLSRAAQMEFWFAQFNQSAESKEISWAHSAVVSKSSLFSFPISQTLHATLNNNNQSSAERMRHI